MQIRIAERKLLFLATHVRAPHVAHVYEESKLSDCIDQDRKRTDCVFKALSVKRPMIELRLLFFVDI